MFGALLCVPISLRAVRTITGIMEELMMIYSPYTPPFHGLHTGRYHQNLCNLAWIKYSNYYIIRHNLTSLQEKEIVLLALFTLFSVMDLLFLRICPSGLTKKLNSLFLPVYQKVSQWCSCSGVASSVFSNTFDKTLTSNKNFIVLISSKALQSN